MYQRVIRQNSCQIVFGGKKEIILPSQQANIDFYMDIMNRNGTLQKLAQVRGLV